MFQIHGLRVPAGFLLALVVLSWPIATNAQSGTKAQQTAVQRGVPIEYLAHLAVAKGSINGEGPHDLVIDTGAGVMVLNSRLAEALALPVVGKSTVGSPMGGEPLEVDSVRVASMKIGEVMISDIPAVVMDLDQVFRGLEAPDAIVAAASFEGHLMTLDYLSGRLWIREGALPPADGRRVLEYDGASTVPRIPITVAGQTISVALDTGSPARLALPLSHAANLPLESEPAVSGQGRTVDSSFEILSSILDGSVQIGDITIERPSISFNEHLGHGNLGTGILREHALTIDRSNQRLSLGRAESSEMSGVPVRQAVKAGGKKSYGIRFGGLGGDLLEVIGVDPELPAARGGLKSGDSIVRMNGELVKGLSTEERIAHLRVSPLELLVERDGETMELHISHD